MGIWESLQWTAEAGRRGLADPAAAAIGCAGRAAGATATAIVGTGRAVGAAAGGPIGGAGRAAMGGAGWAAGAAAGAATAIIGTGRAVGAAAGEAIGGAGQAAGAAISGAGQAVGTVAEKVGAGASEGARRMKGAMPDREGWGTISLIAWRITDHALAEYTRAYTFGIPVYRYVKEGLAKPGADSKEKRDRKQEAAGAMKSKKGADQKPEDVIENFMTSGFRGGGFINRDKSPSI